MNPLAAEGRRAPAAAEYRIEPNRDARVADALEREAGFLRGQNEVERRHRLQSEGFFLARDAEGTIAGACAVFAYREGGLAWVGGMFVRPPHRRRGVARALLDHCIAYAHSRAGRLIGLDASPAGRSLYASVGFEKVASTDRWRRAAVGPIPEPEARSATLQPFSHAELREVGAFDRPRFGAGRSAWLAEVLADLPERAFCAYDRSSGGLIGFAMGQEQFVGPLVADSSEAARRLLAACVAAGTPPLIHIVDNNPAAVQLVSSLGFEAQDVVQERMILGGTLPGRPETLFGVGAWALG